ncbi:lysine-specific demethylase 7A-like isoform X2 [Physella acuta]|uniref:lysine-specific demethylase 7A-like isoform X2 n=1 Tax=Physella acuta TaxID=109671 RepID=UPI0027DB9D12|nr:lysine-specific demethylase 7A-like isoform X2 [Physella acuta]
MASDEDPVYCLCRLPYDETRFMIECDVCKDWFHGGCVDVQEHQAADIEIYHCPNCAPKHGPLVLKHKRNWHRHDYSEDGSKIKNVVQTGTVLFIKELKNRTFPNAEEIPIEHLHGSQVTAKYFEENGFDVPILCEKKDGLNLILPPPSITIQEIENLVGSMREIDVIDVARQDDIKMPMREWTEYYNSPNRDKILNVISLEFSSTKLSEKVEPPKIIKDVSWARNVWPEQLPEDSTLVRPEVQKYCLMGVKDSFTDFHIDFGGTSVWYHVLRGEKIFYLIKPTQANLMLYERWLSSSKQNEMFFGDQVDKCYCMTVKQGHTLFIPTGWIHAVFTPIDSLVFGGNFLHNYNIPLQLQCYEIERTVKTPEKYLFPSYETMNWYAAKSLLEILNEYTEEGRSPPNYLIAGARALSVSLKSWTQRKDYAKVGKQDAAEYIPYGKVLKEIQKEIKKIDNMKSPKKKDPNGSKSKISPKKSEPAIKKKLEKPSKGSKKAPKILDVLDQHTKESLKMTNNHSKDGTVKTAEERELREKIYNFDDDDEETNVSLKVRIPKAGAYIDDSNSEKHKKSKDIDKKLIKSEDEIKSEDKHIPSKSKPVNQKAKVKKKEEGIKLENNEDTKPQVPATPSKEVPQCLKFKLSNGKMVSTDKKKKKSKKLNVKEFVMLGPETEKPAVQSSKETTKDKKNSNTTPVKKDIEKSKKKKVKEGKNSSSKHSEKESSSKGDKIGVKGKVKSEQKKETKKKSKTPAIVTQKMEQDSDSDHLVVDENPVKTQKSTSATKPASLKRKLPPGASKSKPTDSDEEEKTDATKQEVDTIRGGLNGSISDILTASGYSGMRDAIAGMLTMSRMGDSGIQSSKEKAATTVQEEEEKLMADCYRDDEFVYPSFELSDEEEDSMYSSRKKSEKDDNWNPKARVNSVLAKPDREHRVGVQKESVATSLANTAAKLAENPPSEKKHWKKLPKQKVPEKKEFEVEPLPGPSTAVDEPVNAFRPGIKRPIDPCANAATQPPKLKKVKKGLATAKQRLGKLLKIKKMVY